MNAQERQWQRPSPDRERLSLWAAIRRLHIQGAEAPVHATLLTSLSLTSMVFGLVCSPCFAEEFADALAPFRFDTIHGAWWDRFVAADGSTVVRRSADRYVRAVTEPGLPS